MPVHKVPGGWKWGKSGKVYSNRSDAEKQAKAIYASGYHGKSIKDNLGGASMAKSKDNKYRVVHLKKNLDSLINKIEKASLSPDKYDAKGRPNPNGAYDAGGHYDAEAAANSQPPEPENIGKADIKNIAGTGIGAGIGAGLGGGLGAAAGGVLGNELTKPKVAKSSDNHSIGESGGLDQMSMDYRLSKCNAALQLNKAITLMEGYSPMSYLDLVKAFGSTEKIPDIMKEEIYRPSTAWFELAIKKSSEITTDPFGYAISFWYGKGAEGLIASAAADPKGFGQGVKSTGEGVNTVLGGKGVGQGVGDIMGGAGKVGPAVSSIGEGIGDLAQTPQRSGIKTFKQGLNAIKSKEDETEDDNVEKLLGGALLGGGIGAAMGGGIGGALKGAAIGAGAEETTKNLLGKSIELADPTKLGAFILNELKLSDVYQKSVTENIDSKYSPKERKPKFDEGGESEISGDGTRANVHDLADKSKTAKTL